MEARTESSWPSGNPAVLKRVRRLSVSAPGSNPLRLSSCPKFVSGCCWLGLCVCVCVCACVLLLLLLFLLLLFYFVFVFVVLLMYPQKSHVVFCPNK